MSLEHLLSSYAKTIGIDSIARRRDGSHVLVFDRRYKVRFIAEGTSTALLQSVVGTVPRDPMLRRSHVDRIMAAATARMRSGPEVISFSEDGDRILLHRRFAVDLPPHAFTELLSSFVNAAAFWERHLAAAPSASTAPPIEMMFR